MLRPRSLGFIVAGIAALNGFFGLSWQAIPQQAGVVAESTLLELHIDPELSTPRFDGVVGHVESGPGTHNELWNQDDPQDVLSYVSGWNGTPTPPAARRETVSDDVGSRVAETAWNGFGIRLNADRPGNLLSFGAVHTTARCTQAPLAPSANASANVDQNTVYLFDDQTNQLREGENHVPATGSQLGLPGVATAGPDRDRRPHRGDGRMVRARRAADRRAGNAVRRGRQRALRRSTDVGARR